MKRIIPFILLIMSLGCRPEEIPDKMGILMLEISNPASFEKSVVLFENDEYLIVTPFDTYISSYPFENSAYSELKEKAIRDIVIHDTLLVQNYVRKENDAIYILAFHLENGSCLIFDKKRQSTIKKIELENYQTGGPMTTTGGRRFYISGKLFLETVDFMS